MNVADIELLIKISEEDYIKISNSNLSHADDFGLYYAIKNGTLLQKEHGRIIDENKITKCKQVGLIIKDGDIVRCLVTDAPTIIERNRPKVR